MKTIRNIEINSESHYLVTKGLSDFIKCEVSLLIKDKSIEQYTEVLEYLINYFIDYKPLINDEQTIAYHSWLLKVVVDNQLIYLYEVKKDGDGFIEGVDYAISVISEQKQECMKYDVVPSFPTFSQMIIVSKGVLEGEKIDAVRYPSPNHMTGWWLTTEQYDDDTNSLETLHYYHIVFKRPDIIKHLALPFGFRFFSGQEGDVWFDEEVLA